MSTTNDRNPLPTGSSVLAAAEPVDACLRLSMSLRRRGRAVIGRACGEVDAYTLPRWRRLLNEVAESVDPPGPMVIDTDGLEFIGCRALTVVAEHAARCRRRGVRLSLVSTQRMVARILDAGGLRCDIETCPTVEDALAYADRLCAGRRVPLGRAEDSSPQP